MNPPAQPDLSGSGPVKPGTSDAAVRAIPQWVREWGFFPLGVAFLILAAMIANVGHAHGKDVGWFLFVLLLAACALAWMLDYGRRLDNAKAALRLKLYGQSCLEIADTMSGHQFEFYYAALLDTRHWTCIKVIGRKAGGDGGADILATRPDGRRFAIQCKRYALTKAVAIKDVRELNGALAREHPGLLGMMVTTSRLTSPAEQLARSSGIKVIVRAALAEQMARVRLETEQKNGGPVIAVAFAETP